MPTVVITGGTSGIGLATARLLSGRGTQVVATGRSEASLVAARAALSADVDLVRADARETADAQALAEHVRERHGSLDGVFLNAGITRRTPIDHADVADWDQLHATNARGTFATLLALLPLLGAGASVLVTVGIGATRGVPGNTVSAASRGALLTMVPSLALELAPRGIRVNALSPGAIDTPIWDRGGASPADVAASKAALAATIPLGRLGDPAEIAEAAAFLLSPAASYVTGQNLVVSGGL